MLRALIKHSDEQLMLRYGQGKEAAFCELYQRHKGELYRYFRRNVQNGCADDLFQETWQRVINQRENYQASAPFRHWLYRIAHSRLVDHYRSQQKLQTIDTELDDTPSTQATPAEHHLASEQQQQLLQAIAQLPFAQREAFLLQQEAGFSLGEIADIVDSNREAIKSRLRYAKQTLQKSLEACL